VISTSAPHLYHSALPLSPRTSIVHELHKPYVRPLSRVVYGLPISWEPVVATVRHRWPVTNAAWSPCSRFIAVALFAMIEILDAVTLERLHTFTHPSTERTGWLSFSPDSRSLTQFHDYGLTTWDLQTGGRISVIPLPSNISHSQYFSSTYSMDGKMVAVAYRDTVYNDNSVSTSNGISTYNLLSGTQIYSHDVSKGRIVASIWTHGEFLRFATVKPGSIAIWEGRFTSESTLAEIESLSAPDDIGSEEHLFLPTRSRLAFILGEAVMVWDARDSTFLLNFVVGNRPKGLFFSSDGHFFACGTTGQEVHLLKESPTGYVLHRKLVSSVVRPLSKRDATLLSPNGESIITSKYSETRLWRTTDPVTSLSRVPTQPVQRTRSILGFSQDELLAAFTRSGDNMATIVDLRSGDPRLIIDADTRIYGLGVTGTTIVVVGDRGIITWNLPAEDGVLDARMNIDSVRTIELKLPTVEPLYSASISPNFNYIAVVRGSNLEIYKMSTGDYLAGTGVGVKPANVLGFTPDEREVWFVDGLLRPRGCKIVEDREYGGVELELLGWNESMSDRFPSHGYKVTDDGWMLNSRKTRLIWLPHHWRKYQLEYSWGGRFLGLLDDELSEPIILELGQ